MFSIGRNTDRQPDQQNDLLAPSNHVSSIHHSSGHTYSAVYASDHSRPHLGDVHYHQTIVAGADLVEKLSSSLFFPDILSRYDNIEDSCSDTFQWLLRPPNDSQPQWDSFIDWLAGDGCLYWISGKPGSGKSTLMKYLLDETFASSEHRTNSPIVLSYWFWEASNMELQRNLTGCLRSLLWQLLQNQEVGRVIADCIKGSANINWTDKRLLKALTVAFLKLSQRTQHVLILLDGLDECGANAKPLLTFIKDTTTRYSRVKFCVSSRPEQLFKIHLASFPYLQMQDLNAPDIETIVRAELLESPEFAILGKTDVERVQEIKEAIHGKAQGVLLWVRLAIKELLRGLGNRDSIDELRIRLEKLPEEIHDFYGFILRRNNADAGLYREHAALYFQLISDSELSLVEFWLSINDDIRQAYLGFADGWEDLHRQFDREKLETWINARAAGLLEVQDHSSSWGKQHSVRDQSFTSIHNSRSLMVNFIHRTAKAYVTDTMAGRELLSACSKTPAEIHDQNFDSSAVHDLILFALSSTWPCGRGIISKISRRIITSAQFEVIQQILQELLHRDLLWLERFDVLSSGVAGIYLSPGYPASEGLEIDFCKLWASLGRWEFSRTCLPRFCGGTEADYLTSIFPYALSKEHVSRDAVAGFLNPIIEAGANPNCQIQTADGELISFFHEILYLAHTYKFLNETMEQWLMQSNDETFSRTPAPTLRNCYRAFFGLTHTATWFLLGDFGPLEVEPTFGETFPQSLRSRMRPEAAGSGPCILLSTRDYSKPFNKTVLFRVSREDAHRLLSDQHHSCSGRWRDPTVGIIEMTPRSLFFETCVADVIRSSGSRLYSFTEAMLVLGKSQTSITNLAAAEEARLKPQLDAAQFTRWQSIVWGAKKVIHENSNNTEYALEVWDAECYNGNEQENNNKNGGEDN